MPSACVNCGAKFSFSQRLSGAQLCPDCIARQQQVIADAQNRLFAAIGEVIRNPVTPAAGQLPALTAASGLDAASLARMRGVAMGTRLDELLDDDYLSDEEENAFMAGLQSLGISAHDIIVALGPNYSKMQIASFNAGRLPSLDAYSIMLKKGEVAHLEERVQLMKEVTLRETRGGYGGFSFPVTKGVRFRTGAFKAHSVVVGTAIQVADVGTLTVTSQRVVFSGSRKTLEFLLPKIVGIQVFTDGVQIAVSNRQNPSLFKLGDGQVMAAAINAAVQKTA